MITLNLTAGWHRLHVSMSSPYGSSREFSAGEINTGRQHPFDTLSVRTKRIDDRTDDPRESDASRKVPADVVAVGVVVGVADAAATPGAPGKCGSSAVSAGSGDRNLHRRGRRRRPASRVAMGRNAFMVMTGRRRPDDLRTYARDILLNGP
jgi:hypothetical protein